MEERAWAHASLAELWLLRLARTDVEDDEERTREIGESRSASRHRARSAVSFARGFPDHLDPAAIRAIRRLVGTSALRARSCRPWARAPHALDEPWRTPRYRLARHRTAAAEIRRRRPLPPGIVSVPRGVVHRLRRRPHVPRRAIARPRSPVRSVPRRTREGALAWRPSGGRPHFSTSGCCRPDMAIAFGSSTVTPRRRIDGSSTEGPRRAPPDFCGTSNRSRRTIGLRIAGPVAHRFGPYRRRTAADESRPERVAIRRCLVQRMAAPLRPARGQAGRDVLLGDPGHEPAVECMAAGSGDRRRGRTICPATRCRAE